MLEWLVFQIPSKKHNKNKLDSEQDLVCQKRNNIFSLFIF